MVPCLANKTTVLDNLYWKIGQSSSPSPVVRGCHLHISRRTTPSSSSSLRRSPAWAHVIIVSPVRWHVVAATPSAGGHAVKPASTAPAPGGEASHRSAPSLFIHCAKATIVIGFIIKVGVILLSTTFNRSLEIQKERESSTCLMRPRLTTRLLTLQFISPPR